MYWLAANFSQLTCVQRFMMSIHIRRHFLLLATVLFLPLLLPLCGCGGGAPDPAPSGPQRKMGAVRLLVIDDTPLAAVIQREWKARADSKLEVTSITSAELAGKTQLSADAVIYPAGLLGELAERQLIQPLPSSTVKQTEYAVRDVLTLPRTVEGKWAGKDYCIPFGSPQLVVMCRADLFTQAGINFPTDWQTYEKVAAHFSERKNWGGLAPADGQPVYGAVEPLSADWAGQMLLARAACYARAPNRISTLFDYQSMDPQIASPAFVRALTEARRVASLQGGNSLRLDPHEVRKVFLQGNAAMAITWPTAAGVQPEEAASMKVKYLHLPGSSSYYSPSQKDWFEKNSQHRRRSPLLGVAGRLGSVVAGANDVRDAGACLAVLAGRQLSSDISPQSSATTMFRGSHLAGAEKWVDQALASSADRYADIVVEAQEESLVLHSIRIPGRDEYLTALNTAVTSSLDGADAKEALQQAADKWKAITTARDMQKQKQAYRHSLGLE